MKNYLAAMALSAFALASGAANAAVVMYTPTQSVSFAQNQTDYNEQATFDKFDPTLGVLNSVHIWLEATVYATNQFVTCFVPGTTSGLCQGKLEAKVTATLSTVAFPPADLITTIPVTLQNYSQGAGTVNFPDGSATKSEQKVYCILNVPGCDVIDAAIVALFAGPGTIDVNLFADGETVLTGTDGAAFGLAELSASGQARLYYDYFVAPVPVPASLPLLVGGVALLGWAARRRKAA